MGPLKGIKVIEYGIFYAGPGGGAILGDLGADVIKIENKKGDPIRRWTRLGDVNLSLPDGVSLMHHAANRNKRSITLDLQDDQDKEIFFRLIKDADVFLTNIRGSTRTNLGIGYDKISKLNKKIIYASVSGYGHRGKLKDLGAYDPMAQARSGMMFVAGTETPSLIHLAVVDQATAIALSHGIITALFARERTGTGEEVQVSLYSTALWLLYANMVAAGVLNKDVGQRWVRSKNLPVRNFFCCKDNKWIMGVHHPEEKYWPILCEATGQEQLLSDTRFVSRADRERNCASLISIFDEVFKTLSRDEWIEKLVSHGLLFAPVQNVLDVFNDEEAVLNEYVVDFNENGSNPLKIPGYPIHFANYQPGTQKIGPQIGEHSEEILRELGYDDTLIKQYREKA